jgi:hypothetical protein
VALAALDYFRFSDYPAQAIKFPLLANVISAYNQVSQILIFNAITGFGCCSKVWEDYAFYTDLGCSLGARLAEEIKVESFLECRLFGISKSSAKKIKKGAFHAMDILVCCNEYVVAGRAGGGICRMQLQRQRCRRLSRLWRTSLFRATGILFSSRLLRMSTFGLRQCLGGLLRSQGQMAGVFLLRGRAKESLRMLLHGPGA